MNIDLEISHVTPRLIGFKRSDGTIAFVPRNDVKPSEDGDCESGYEASEEIHNRHDLR